MQFDVHPNPSTQTCAHTPYLLNVQSDALTHAERRVVVPLVRADMLAALDTILNPTFEIAGQTCALLPLDIVSIPARVLSEPVTNLAQEGDRIVRALDQLIARY